MKKMFINIQLTLYKHAIAFFLLLLPLALGYMGNMYLSFVMLITIFYFSLRSLKNVKWSLVIYLFLWPLLPNTWALNLHATVLPLLTIKRLLILILVFSFFINRKQYRYHQISYPPMLNLALGLLIVSYFLSALFALDIKVASYQLFHFLLEQLLLMYITFKVLETANDALTGLLALVCSTFILAAFGIIEYYQGANHFSVITLGEGIPSIDMWSTYGEFLRLGKFGRLTSLTTHPMILGGFLAMTFPILMSFVFTSRSVLSKGYFVTIFITSSLCLFMTLSRSPIMAWLAGISVMLILIPHSLKMNRLLGILFLLMVLLYSVSMLSDTTFELLRSSLWFWEESNPNLVGSTFESRKDMLYWTIDQSFQSPIVGYGLGNWLTLMQKGITNWMLIGFMENFWLQRLLETGWFGLASLLLFIVLVFYYIGKKAFKAVHDKDESTIFILGCFASLVSFIVFASATGEMTLFDMVFIIFPFAIRLSGPAFI